jgi:hypothetical protein
VHRTAAVLFHYKAKVVIWTQSCLRKQFNVPGHGAIPSCNRILVWIHKFEDTGSVMDRPHHALRAMHSEVFAEQGNHSCAVHVAQLCNIHASWTIVGEVWGKSCNVITLQHECSLQPVP